MGEGWEDVDYGDVVERAGYDCCVREGGLGWRGIFGGTCSSDRVFSEQECGL